MRNTLRISAVVAAALMATSAFAQSGSGDGMRAPGGLYDATPKTRSPAITVWGIWSWYYSIGVGGRYSHPLMPDGFLAEMNDSLEIDVGGDIHPLGGFYGGMYFDIAGGPRWTFHLMPNLSVYGKIEIGFQMHTAWGGVGGWNPLFLDFAPGVIYKFSQNLHLRAEAGYTGLRGGVTWAF